MKSSFPCSTKNTCMHCVNKSWDACLQVGEHRRYQGWRLSRFFKFFGEKEKSQFISVTNLINLYIYQPFSPKSCAKTNISLSCSKLVFVTWMNNFFSPLESEEITFSHHKRKKTCERVKNLRFDISLLTFFQNAVLISFLFWNKLRYKYYTWCTIKWIYWIYIIFLNWVVYLLVVLMATLFSFIHKWSCSVLNDWLPGMKGVTALELNQAPTS